VWQAAPWRAASPPAGSPVWTRLAATLDGAVAKVAAPDDSVATPVETAQRGGWLHCVKCCPVNLFYCGEIKLNFKSNNNEKKKKKKKPWGRKCSKYLLQKCLNSSTFQTIQQQ
jgi:hypothetical protein